MKEEITTIVKIISDPYARNVEFETINNTTGEWEPVNLQNNPGSRLIKEDIQKNFFPYKVKEILTILQEEYGSDDKTLLVFFEGTADEFQELKEASEGMENFELQRLHVGIENARDILPKIVDIFNEIRPIVERSLSSGKAREVAEKDIKKFTEASSDNIPICVLGNVSSGKSTFINALIGMEILPSGDMPVTAKIYRIEQLPESDRAVIDFEYDGKTVVVNITGPEYTVDSADENELITTLNNILYGSTESSLEEKVNQCLDVINKRRNGISDLISIKIPFAQGPLKDADKSFVIFDTPGSNTATHKDHSAILEGAMKNMSNGIPIYVAEYSSLDSCDNERLYKKIKNISQIDSRFTMIIVNKADTANIKEKEFDKYMEDMILEEAVPRNLYSGGIYFVSSIMGLGAKKNGAFIDEHAEEFFEGNKEKYRNASSKWYKTLYKYNIMPDQIKHRLIRESEMAEDVIIANSGLLAVEHEIVNFAEKYSAYDKCKQSDKYIDNIIELTQIEIEQKREERAQAKKELEDKLDADKKELVNTVENSSKELSEEYVFSYDVDMKDCRNSVEFCYSVSDVKDIENNIMMKKKDIHDYAGKAADVKKSGAAILDDISEIKEQGVVETFKDVGDDIKATIEKAQRWNDARIDADKETADELVSVMTDDFNERIDQAAEVIDKASQNLWERRAEETKDALLKIIAEASTIDDDKKKELSNIIISYGSIRFDNEHVFEKPEFEKKLWLPGVVIYLNKINTKKLTESYNDDYAAALERVYKRLKRSHRISYKEWRIQLVTKLRNNIVNYSPKLSAQAQQIEEETKAILELERTISTLAAYGEQINALMEPKPIA